MWRGVSSAAWVSQPLRILSLLTSVGAGVGFGVSCVDPISPLVAVSCLVYRLLMVWCERLCFLWAYEHGDDCWVCHFALAPPSGDYGRVGHRRFLDICWDILQLLIL